MKNTEVKIGGKYYATVTNKRVEIQIDSVNADGGWNAINLATGKKILIKSAEKLQAEVGAKRGRTKATTEGKVTVADSAQAAAEPIIIEAANPIAVPKMLRKAKSEPTENVNAEEKRLSCVAAALKVLNESSEPMNAQELIAAMEAKGYWTSPGGKTPHATLYSAILRELAKGDASKFVKTERGRFATRG